MERKISKLKKSNIKMNDGNEIVKPILKWVGGKTQIIEYLLSQFPKEMENYYELFLGGGSVLFALLSYIKSGKIQVHNKIFAFDVNEPLIFCYKNIQHHHEELFEAIQSIIIEFNSCSEDGPLNRKPSTIEQAKELKENYYYWIRNRYNQLKPEGKNSILGSAMFIFLNKTCFRGVFREGPNGFNVPYGHYKSPEIINKEHLDSVHHLIQNVEFRSQDFSVSLGDVEDNSFIYMDPPYAPENEKSFVSYTKEGFTLEKHKELFGLCNALDNKKKFILSNADTELVRQSFKENRFEIQSILCKRSINSKNPESKSLEVIIKNF